jgi:stearoyl-CoA desaturase (delta-9 desaturase)
MADVGTTMHLGLIDLPWWGYVGVTLALTHVTIASVTIFLHRHQAHRALDLHPLAGHFFRFWLWLTTGMVTKEWTAVHRKHHAACENHDDPHSPQVYGIRAVLLRGTELYKAEARNPATLERYGRGTPDDWLERNLYSRFSWQGVGLMLAIDLVLFGPLGATMWAVQMLWIPVTAAGIVNGIGHYWGYRNYVSSDASTNIVPWGLLIGGEELHNNHHAYVTSAKLSSNWWELDIGWIYICVLVSLRLATVRRVAPPIRFDPTKSRCDLGTLRAVTTHRYDVLARFARSLERTVIEEVRRAGEAVPGLRHSGTLGAIKHWLQRDAQSLPQNERAALNQALDCSPVLRTIYRLREELKALWSRSSASKEQLLGQLNDWSRRAEASGIRALQEFSRALRSYA